MVKKTRTILSNGLPLVVIEIPDSKSLVTSFWTKAGSRLDPEGKAGLAHFIEHLLIKKCEKYPADVKLARVLEKVGAFKNGTTSKDWLNLNISSAAKDMELTTRILSEMIYRPLMEIDGFDAERKVIFEEQAKTDTSPQELMWKLFTKVFFAPSPLKQPVVGTKESLETIKLGDATSFWNTLVLSKDAILMLAGGIRAGDAKTAAEKYFGTQTLKKAISIPNYQYRGKERISLEKRLLPQVNSVLGFRTFGGFPTQETYPLFVLRVILAGNWSSRIVQRLRVKESLIYGWGAQVMRLLDTGMFTLQLATSKKNFQKVISILGEELVKLKEEGISQKELSLAKGYIEGSESSGIETSWDYTDWYAYDELFWPEKVESVEERIANIQKVTKEEVELVAKKYLTKENWYMGVTGDIKEKEIKLEL